MSEIKLSKEQFEQLYEQLKVPAQINKDDIFEWRNKDEKNILKKTEKKSVPLQKLSDLES